MKEQLQQMAFQEKQAAIAKMAERNDAIREPEMLNHAPINPEIVAHGHEDIEYREEQMNEKEAMKDATKAAMMEELQRMNKEQLNALTERNLRVEPEELS